MLEYTHLTEDFFYRNASKYLIQRLSSNELHNNERPDTGKDVILCRTPGHDFGYRNGGILI